MLKLGIFGGTFNPVHNMHLRMASCYVSQMKLDSCIFVPAYISPFKTNATEIPASAEHRLKMLEQALQDSIQFQIETYEIDKKGISYTIDTLNYLKHTYTEAELYLLIGSDQLKDFTKWKDWEEILSIVNLCIVKRPDAEIENMSFLKNKCEIYFIEVPESDISSSKIREMVCYGQSVSTLVPKEVEDYIFKNKLYK